MAEQPVSIDAFFTEADKIEVFVDGNVSEFTSESPEFIKITEALASINADGYEMPALGVSVDSLTRKETRSGVWLRFVFSERSEHNGMPFDALLIKVDPSFRGYNIERMTDGFYGGRCFYFNLNSRNMGEVFDVVSEITT